MITEKTTLIDIVKRLVSQKESCCLKISSSSLTGSITINKGRVINAQTDDILGERAFSILTSEHEPIIEFYKTGASLSYNINEDFSKLIEDTNISLKNPSGNDMNQPIKSDLDEDSPLQLDSSTMLTIETNTKEATVTSVAVGQYKLDYIIVTTPKDWKTEEYKDQELIVNYIHKGRKWFFKTQIRANIEQPTPLLFLAYPKYLNYHDMRRVKRAAIMVPSLVETSESGGYYGTLVDLSPLGALCQVHIKDNPSLTFLHIGGVVTIKCILPGLKDELTFTGIIRNHRFGADNTKIGIEFLNIQENTSQLLEKYLYSKEKRKHAHHRDIIF
ncbi:MAG: flagellar brake domain-containing protein [Desulfotalea sp.]